MNIDRLYPFDYEYDSCQGEDGRLVLTVKYVLSNLDVRLQNEISERKNADSAMNKTITKLQAQANANTAEINRLKWKQEVIDLQ